MAVIDEKTVREHLSRIPVPGGGDLESGGLLAGLTINGGAVMVMISTTADQAAAMEDVRQACEAAIAALPGVEKATAVLTAEMPAEAAPPPPEKLGAEGVASIIAVASGKGGVGKSTTAVNLAMALARLGKSVGILDADIYGPSIPRMMGVDANPRQLPGNKLEPAESYGVKCMSMGFLVQEDDPIIWRGAMVMGALEQMLNDVIWAPLDILVVDMPPGTGDVQLTLAQKTKLAGAVIVSTPQDIALLDARKGINMFHKVNVPILGIIENMSYFLCPGCGERHDIFSTGGARLTAEKYAAPFLGDIPLDLDIRETSDGGRPIVVSKSSSAHAKAYMEIAANLVESMSVPRASPKITIE